MKFLYDFSIWAISGALQLAKGGDSKLARLVKGRIGVFEDLEAFRQRYSGGLIWFHVASLGEFEQAKPVIAQMKDAFPELKVVLTFFSPSGYENVVKKPQPYVDLITYLPFDTPKNAKRFLEILQPKMAFFVKYDLWANFILETKKRNIPLILFSASFRGSQIYFKPYGGFFRELLQAFDHIFTQNQETLKLLKGIGISHLSMTGDTRYDNVFAISQKPKKIPEIADALEGKPIIVVGSAWSLDMEMIIPFINSNSSYHYIIAPHDIDHEVIDQWQASINKKSTKYSQLNECKGDVELLFIDNIGMLSSLYQFSHLAYVGGAMGKGLHNILEPLAFHIPVVFGELKNSSKFPEAGISQNYGCGFMVGNAASFEEIVLNLEKPSNYLKAVEGAKNLVKDNLGSSKKIVAEVEKILKGIWKEG